MYPLLKKKIQDTFKNGPLHFKDYYYELQEYPHLMVISKINKKDELWDGYVIRKSSKEKLNTREFNLFMQDLSFSIFQERIEDNFFIT